MLRAVLTILLLAILVLSSSIAWLVIAPGALKPIAGMLVSRVTGYELTVSGNLQTSISLQPVIVAEGILLTNADWAQEPHLANVEYARVVHAMVLAQAAGVPSVGLITESPESQ